MKYINSNVTNFKSEFLGYTKNDEGIFVPVVKNEIFLTSITGDERIEYHTAINSLEFLTNEQCKVALDLITFGEGAEERLLKREFIRKEMTIEEIEEELGYKIKIKE